VWTLNDDGLATRLEFYLDNQEAEALEAAGLRISRSARTARPTGEQAG